jgi:hypothetical protein
MYERYKREIYQPKFQTLQKFKDAELLAIHQAAALDLK